MNNRRYRILASVALTALALSLPVAAAGQTWSFREPIPLARDYTATTVLDGKVYALGGALAGVRLPDVQIYDPALDRWSPGTPMSLRRDDFTAEALAGRIYVLGGRVSSQVDQETASVEVYDPVTDRWTPAAPMPERLAGHASAVIDGKIYVAGGDRDGIVRDDLWVFDPAAGPDGAWSVLQPMPTARTQLAAAPVDGKLYAIGGAFDGGSAIALPHLEIYDPATDTWSVGPSMMAPRHHATAAELGGKLYIVGGVTPAGPSADVEVFDPATGAWTDAPPMPVPADGESDTAIAVGSSLYLLSGGDVSYTLELATTSADGCNDRDGDGYGLPGAAACAGGLAVDCDDADDHVFPGAAEGENGVDDNCDGRIDEGFDAAETPFHADLHKPVHKLFEGTQKMSDRALVEYFGETLDLPLIELSDGERIYLFEGDIHVDANLVKHLRGDFDQGPLKNAVRWSGRWPNSLVPYVIVHPSITGVVNNAIVHWEANTNLRFIPRTTEKAYLKIAKEDDNGLSRGCSSGVGYNGGAVRMFLASGCGNSQARHEFGHAIGFWHTQSRADRETYVTVTTNPNVYINRRHNYNFPSGSVVGDYDWYSLMHYRAYDFAVRCEVHPECPIYPNCLDGAYCWGPAMVRAPGQPPGGMGSQGQLRPSDITSANALYPSPPDLTLTSDVLSDTYVYEATPTTTYGSSSILSIRYAPSDFGRFSFLKFSIPSPLGTVTSAKLRIRTRGTAFSQTAVYKMGNMSWSESGITWENWDQNGAVTFNPVISNLTLSANTWHEIDVTSAVTASGILSLGIASGADVDQDFHSRESSYKPQLIVQRSGASTLTLNATADAWVAENYPSSNYGSVSYLRVRYDPSHSGKFAFLKFQVPTYSGTLVSAKLRIHTRWTQIPSAAVYRVSGMDYFNEGTVNWLNWDQMGAVDYTSLGTTGALSGNTWHEIDVTNGGADSGTRLVLGLATAEDLSGLDFWSRESSTYVPQLLITYQP